jgi:transcriptional regulator with XRE-family HTH domain
VPTVYARTLRRAAEILGGEESLALRLNVTPSHLALWLKGLASPPGLIFLKAADVVAEHELQELSRRPGATADGDGTS